MLTRIFQSAWGAKYGVKSLTNNEMQDIPSEGCGHISEIESMFFHESYAITLIYNP